MRAPSFAAAAVAAMLLPAAPAAEPGDAPTARAVAAGYWDARVDSAAPDSLARGPLYRLRGVDARDERGLPVEGFRAAEWSGEPASRERVAAARAALQKVLARDGFLFAVVAARLHPDTAGEPFVDLTLTAWRGAAHKLGEPVVRETRTRPDVARRLALWDAGENVSPERLERGVARLRRTGYYESAAWEGLYRDESRNVLYPVLALPDARANTVGGLLGYDSEAASGDRVTGFLDVRLVNMLGTARDFAFSFDARAEGEREAAASYVEPWLLNLPVGARWEGRFLQQDTVFHEWELEAVLFRDLDFTRRVEARFGIQENRDLLAGTGSRAVASGVRVLHDGRDRVPFTTAGSRAEIGLDGVRRVIDAPSDSSYYLAQVRAAGEAWRPLAGRAGLRLGARGAANAPLDRLNRGELHDVGGARSLRGYREREFQTNAYLIADLEVYYALGRRGRVLGFASPGLVNRPVGRIDPRRVLGYGAGLELAQGDWSVALTYALNPDRSPGNGYLHAAVENRF